MTMKSEMMSAFGFADLRTARRAVPAGAIDTTPYFSLSSPKGGEGGVRGRLLKPLRKSKKPHNSKSLAPPSPLGRGEGVGGSVKLHPSPPDCKRLLATEIMAFMISWPS